MFLKKMASGDTSSQFIIIGPLLGDYLGTDPVSNQAANLSVVTNNPVRLAKGLTGQLNPRTLLSTSTNTVTAVTNFPGLYRMELKAADLDTAGDLWIVLPGITNTYRDLRQHCVVLEPEVYDNLVAGQSPADFSTLGPQGTFIGRLQQLWWRHFKQVVLNYGPIQGQTEGTIKTFKSDNTTTLTTQSASDNGAQQTVGKAT